MRIARPPKRQTPETIVALIDVVFFLLVFFMLVGRLDATAPFEVDPPLAQSGTDMPGGGITLSVAADGTLALDGNLVDDAVSQLVARVSEDPGTLVRINAHQTAELRYILPIIAQVEAAGARDVALVVTPSDTP